MRPLKMGVFAQLVGVSLEPQAKMGTVLVLIPVLVAYNKIYSALGNPKSLVTVVCGTYAGVFLLIALGLARLDFGPHTLPQTPTGYGDPLGWLVYWAIETYGSVTVPMLWSVTASVTDSDIAPVAYPLVVIAQQLGAIAGASLATYTSAMGFVALFTLQACTCIAIAVLTRAALDANAARREGGGARPPKQLETSALGDSSGGGGVVVGGNVSNNKANNNAGLLEGLWLIAAHRYVAGIAIISTFAEVVSTIMDFQMKMIARQEYQTGEEMAMFMGRFGQASNACSLALALFGTQTAMKQLGLQTCLLAFPAALAVVIAVVWFFPRLNVLFGAMVAIKALGYALNGPAREMLYVRTGSTVKFKAKSWIDMFGTRGAKAAGSVTNNALRHSIDALLQWGSLLSAGCVATWLAVALALGRLHTQYARDNIIVK